MRAQQLHELGPTVDRLPADSGPILQVRIQLAHVLDAPHRARRDNHDPRFIRHQLLAQQVDEVVLREVVNDIGLAELGLAGGLLGAVGDAGVEEEVVQLGGVECGESLLGKRLGALEVGELEREDGQVVLGVVVLDGVVGGLGAGDVAGAEDESVGLLGLGEELFDCFEALWRGLVICQEGRAEGGEGGGSTRPEEAPVATTVFTIVEAILSFVLVGYLCV